VEVISRANFEEDSIVSINVTLTYGNKSENVTLDSKNQKGSVYWFSLIESGSMRRDVKVRYKVTFKGINATDRPVDLTSPEHVTTDNVFEVNPRELYSIVPVPIVAYNVSWQNYTRAEVKLQYYDEPNQIHIDDVVFLDADHTTEIFPLFIRDPKKRTFKYKVIYHESDYRDLDMGWVDTSEEQISLWDPHPMKRTVQVVSNIDWELVARAYVDLSYKDAENNIFEEGSMMFIETTPPDQSFTVDIADSDKRFVTYQITVVFKDHKIHKIPNSVTMDRRITVSENTIGHKIIYLHPEETNFAFKNLKEISVELLYEDPEVGLRFNDIFTFKSSKDKAYFEFDYVADDKSKYKYKVTYFYVSGLSRTEDWKKVGSTELAIKVA
jgi:hypothetical protein